MKSKDIQQIWNKIMYVVVSVVTLIASEKEFVPFFIIICTVLTIAMFGGDLIFFIYSKHSSSEHDGLMGRTVTKVNTNGDYTLDASDLYEAIEKLGYIEHELNGEYNGH